MAKNDVIPQVIIGFVGLEGASLDRQCGVAFWATSINVDQSEFLRKSKGVKGLASDGTVTNVGSKNPQKQMEHAFTKRHQVEKKYLIDKRDAIRSRSNKEKEVSISFHC